MGKIKKTNYRLDFPDPVEMQDELEEMVPDIICSVYVQLSERQDVKPTMEDVMMELARRHAAVELNMMHDNIEMILRAQDKPATKLEKAQAAADIMWAKFPGRSKRHVAKILSDQGIASFDHLNINLKKP